MKKWADSFPSQEFLFKTPYSDPQNKTLVCNMARKYGVYRLLCFGYNHEGPHCFVLVFFDS